MSFLSRFTIAKRLGFVLGAILLLCLSGSIYAIVQLQSLGRSLQAMIDENLVVERAASDWMRHTASGIQRASAIAKSSDASLVEYFAPFSAASIHETDKLQKLVEQHMNLPEEAALFKRIGENRKTYLAAREEVARLRKAGDADGAARAFGDKFEPASRVYVESVQQMLALQRQQFDAASANIVAQRDRVSLLLLVTGALSLVVGGTLAWVLARSITRPLAEAERAAQAMAQLDLHAAAVQVNGDDELARLLRAVDAMRGALQRSLLEVRSVVDGISTASAQIATGNQDLSIRTEQTASNLQQAASAMEELTGTVRNSAESARQANALSAAAADVAQRGGAVIGRVVSTMDEIHGSAQRIADIIGVIDGIAFQTNILALNAAVEAARAGEQGRGFAVVAGEVRTLAGRSADAAREIKSLIGESVSRAEAGATLVKDAGSTMQEIVGSVQRVSQIVDEISRAAAEQSTGICKVNGTVSSLDQMTQQNAALVEESAAAAASLREQAERLAGSVSAFRLSAA